MSLLESLRRGWWSGWAEFPELVAGGAGLLESLIPGDRPDDPLERLQRWGEESAQGLRSEGGEGRSEGLLEKIAEGLGAAPGTLASMAPSLLVGGAPFSAGARVGLTAFRIAKPAAGFGLHNLVRHGDEGLPTAIGHGLKGAAEGALFGGVGVATGGAFLPSKAKELLPKIQFLSGISESSPAAARLLSRYEKEFAESGLDTIGRNIKRRVAHSVGTGGIVGGMTAAHGGSLEDAVAAGSTMGLLGLLSSGKYRERGPSQTGRLGSVEELIRRKTRGKQLEPLEPLKEAELAQQEGPTPTSAEVARGAKPYDSPLRTETARKRFLELDEESKKEVTRRQAEAYGLKHTEYYYKHKVSPERVIELQENANAINKQKALIAQHKAQALENNDKIAMQRVLEAEKEIHLAEVAEHTGWEAQSGSLTTAARSLVMGRWARRGEPDWVDYARMFEKQFGKEKSARLIELAKLSEGNPELLKALGDVVNTPKAWDYMMEYWINSLLSGFTTQMVNVESNALRQGIDLTEKSVALQAEILRGKTNLKQADFATIIGADVRAAIGQIQTVGRFIPLIFSEAKFDKFFAERPELAPLLERSKLDHPSRVIAGKPGEVARLPGRMLQVMDIWFKTIAGARASAYKSNRIALEEFRAGKIKETEVEGRINELLGKGDSTRTPIYRRGREDGKWWSESKGFVEEGFPGTRQVQETNLLSRAKIATMDEVLAKLKPAERTILDKAGDRATREAVYDAALDRLGADGFTFMESGRAADARTYYLKDVTRSSSKSALTGKPAKVILDAMKDAAEELTFTKAIEAEWGKSVGRLRETPVDIFGFEVKPFQTAIPFWQTPFNVILSAIRRSPLGIPRVLRLKKEYDAGKIKPEQFYQEVAATALGTTLLSGLVVAARAGLITGSGPNNYADRQNLLQTGWRPYSIKVGDNYIQAQRLEPLGTIIGLAGDIAEFGASEDKMSKAMATIKGNLTDKSFLYGLESLAKAWANPEQMASTYYRQMSGSIIPTFFAKAAQAVDPYQRIQEPLGAAAGVPDALAYRIPGVSRALPARTTALGEKAERWGVGSTESPIETAVSAAQSMLFPTAVSKGRSNTEVEKELNRLRGYQGMPPTAPRKTKKMTLKGVTGEDVKLTDDEYAVYDKHHQRAKQHMAQMISSPQWGRIPDSMKAKYLRSVYDKHRRAANNEITMLVRRRTSVGM